MKKIFCLLLVCFMILSLSACGTKSLTEEQIRAVIQDELSKSIDNAENDNNSTFGTPEDDYTKYFNFILVDGKYCALSVKQNIKIPEILVVPNQYKGIEVAYTGANLLDAIPVKTIIFESGVECSYYLCGSEFNCPSLEKIVVLSENPDDFLICKLYPKLSMNFRLNGRQLKGECKVYVPDSSINAYKNNSRLYPYSQLVCSLSELDEDTAKYIK